MAELQPAFTPLTVELVMSGRFPWSAITGSYIQTNIHMYGVDRATVVYTYLTNLCIISI